MERRNDVPNLLAMYIRNTSEIYNITSWLQNCVIKKINNDVQPQVEYLANCSTMKTIIREASKLLYKYDGITPTKQENSKRPGNMLNISLIVCNTSFKTPIEGKIKPYIKRSKTIPIYHP